MRTISRETPSTMSSRSSARQSSASRPQRLGLASHPRKRPASHTATSRRRSLPRHLTAPYEGRDVALGSSRPAAASYRRTASGRFAHGSAVRHWDSWPARRREASSRLSRNRLALDEKLRGTLGGTVVPRGRRLGALVGVRHVAGSSGWVHGRLQRGIGEIEQRESADQSVTPLRKDSFPPIPSRAPPPGDEQCFSENRRIVPHECRTEGLPLTHRARRSTNQAATNAPPVICAAPSYGPARRSSAGTLSGVGPERSATMYPEVDRRQERITVRPRWNRTVAGMLTGPSAGVPPRSCEDSQKGSGNNGLDARNKRASCATLRTSRIDSDSHLNGNTILGTKLTILIV